MGSGAYETYVVNPDWIDSLMHPNMMSLQEGKKELIKAGKTFHEIWTLSRWPQELRQQRLSAHIDDVTMRLHAIQKPMKKIPEVEAWLQEFEVVQHRDMFLLLDGASRLGSPCMRGALRLRMTGLWNWTARPPWTQTCETSWRFVTMSSWSTRRAVLL